MGRRTSAWLDSCFFTPDCLEFRSHFTRISRKSIFASTCEESTPKDCAAVLFSFVKSCRNAQSLPSLNSCSMKTICVFRCVIESPGMRIEMVDPTKSNMAGGWTGAGIGSKSRPKARAMPLRATRSNSSSPSTIGDTRVSATVDASNTKCGTRHGGSGRHVAPSLRVMRRCYTARNLGRS